MNRAARAEKLDRLRKRSGSKLHVRSATIRKEARDPGFTPTEKHRKDRLMRQFMKGDGVKANSPEYIAGYEGIDFSKKTHAHVVDGFARWFDGLACEGGCPA